MMNNTANELFNDVINSIEVKITKTGFTVETADAEKKLAAANFTDLPSLIDCAAKVKPGRADFAKLAECKNREELNHLREQLNVRSVTAVVVPKLVNAELANRNKPVGQQKRA